MGTKQFVRRHKITATSEWTDRNPHMEDFEGNHYKVTLRCGGRRMTVSFSMGYAHTSEPTAEVVLDCLASDASGAEQDFEEWCGDLGFDPDSRKAERTYNAIRQQTEKFKRFLGEKDFEALIHGT